MTGLTSGTVFNQKWTIDKKIGEGAFGSVYTLREKDPSIGALIMKCITLPRGNTKADKEQRKNADTLSYERSLYKGVLNNMDFCAALPLFNFFGEDHGHRYLVMQRLDCDLREYMESSRDGLYLPEIADVGLAILQGLQTIHNRGYLYVDVKPDNFMLLRDHHHTLTDGTKMANKVFFIDFGLVEKFSSVQANGESRERTMRKGAAGTPSFASLDVLAGQSPCRKDDIEALGYLLLFLACGGVLPWDGALSDADCLRLKRSVDFAQDHQFPLIGEFIRAAQALHHAAVPDYSFFNCLLHSMKTTSRISIGRIIGKKASTQQQNLPCRISDDTDKENAVSLSKQKSTVNRKRDITEDVSTDDVSKKSRTRRVKSGSKAALTSPPTQMSPLVAHLTVQRCEAHETYVGKVVPVQSCGDKNGIVLGAVEEECDIFFPEDAFMSSRHVMLNVEVYQNGQLKLRVKDMNSTNGSWINGKKLSPSRWYIAREGDLIQIGNSDFTVSK